METLVCEVCGVSFRGYPGRKHCSRRCYGDSKITRVGRLCVLCGKPYRARPDVLAQGMGRYCSKSCSNRGRKQSLSERFAAIAALAERTEQGCLLWPGTRDASNYGVINADDGRQLRVSRLSLEMRIGPLAPGQLALHRCDNPPCFEPTHLFTGTNADNMADRDAKGRQAKGDRSGARMHPERVRRGEDHPRTRLTETDVRAIRAAYAAGGVSQKTIAGRYGITQGAVFQIVNRFTWRHVE